MKTLVAKSMVLALLVLPLQVAIGWSTHPYACGRRDHLDRLVADGVTTIHFGDSVQRSTSPADRDRRNLHEMLQAGLADERMGSLQSDAGSMELYLACARYLARQDRRPRRLLIPVNLRSFSPEWDPRPEYQLRLELLRLRFGDPIALGFRTPLSLWKIYPLHPLSREEYHRMPVVADGRRIASVGELIEGSRTAPGKTRLESQFLFRYGVALTPDHRKLRAMEAIVDTCRGAGMEPVFYVYPVDVAAAEGAAGPFLREQILRNVQLIRTRMTARNAKILDLSGALPSGAFDWQASGTPHEHLNEQGRGAVAAELQKFLQ